MKNFKLPRITLGAIVWILLLGFVAYRMAPQVGAAVGAGGEPEEAPALALRTLDGESVTLEDYRGKVVLVNFWATWCPPCRVEMPGFQRVYEDREEDGFVILALSTDRGGTGGVRDFIEERGLTFPTAMASAEAVQAFGGVRALPTSFLIDRDGRIRQRVSGIFLEPTLRLAVRHLLAEEPQGHHVAGGAL